jgi:hypothetical protein
MGLCLFVLIGEFISLRQTFDEKRAHTLKFVLVLNNFKQRFFAIRHHFEDDQLVGFVARFGVLVFKRDKRQVFRIVNLCRIDNFKFQFIAIVVEQGDQVRGKFIGSCSLIRRRPPCTFCSQCTALPPEVKQNAGTFKKSI